MKGSMPSLLHGGPSSAGPELRFVHQIFYVCVHRAPLPGEVPALQNVQIIAWKAIPIPHLVIPFGHGRGQTLGEAEVSPGSGSRAYGEHRGGAQTVLTQGGA